MILLNSSSTLQVVLAGAITTTQPQLFASYVDIAADGTTYAPGVLVADANSTTPVTLVTSPAASTFRQIKYLAVYNGDTASATVTVSAGGKALIRQELAVGASLQFDGQAFVIVAAVAGGGGMSNPMTTAGDVIIGGTAGAPVRLAAGTATHVLTSNGAGVAPSYQAGATASRTPAVQSVTSSATVTPTFSDDIVLITAQAAALTLANPTGTAINNLGMVIRIKDNGTARAITYGAHYRAMGVTMPTTTVLSKTLYLAMIYNATDTRWDVLAVGQEA